MGAEVSGLQLHGESGAAAADCAQSGTPVPRESPGTDATGQRCERGTNGRAAGPLSSGLDRLLRKMRNAFGAGEPGSVDQASASVVDLAAVATRINEIRGVAETGSRPRSGRPNGG